MNINKIYTQFYEENVASKDLNAAMDKFAEQMKSLGITGTTYMRIEECVSELLNKQEAEAFKDGFCTGINHITGAMAFANARLAR